MSFKFVAVIERGCGSAAEDPNPGDTFSDHGPANISSGQCTNETDLNFTVERCLKPVNFDNSVTAQIHHFSDASQAGYGTVSYLRLEDGNAVHVSFLGENRHILHCWNALF